MTITVVGLGPAGLEHLPRHSLTMIQEADTVILRTEQHPGASELADKREVVSCDDLYDTLDSFERIYSEISKRVIAASASGSVVYAVPGSAMVGELAVARIRKDAAKAGVPVSILPGLSFLDLVYLEVGLDPIADGLQVLDARDLPDPLPLHVPTIITQADSLLRCADVSLALSRTIDTDAVVTVLDRLGDADQSVDETTVGDLARYEGGPRTSVFVPATLSGLLGLVATHRVLREQCPWDKKQTHHTLLTHLIEEAYETADAIAQLPLDSPGGDPDFGAYAEVEDELGDLLLQVVFHATLASEAGAFDIDEVAELSRRKLVRRHPHVFGDVEVSDADEVLANWEQIKKVEKKRESLMDDIPRAMPGMMRAMKVQKRAKSVGFDWKSASQVIAVLRSEIDELVQELPMDSDTSPNDLAPVAEELGDVLFTAVNLSRHLGIDPEVVLRLSVDKFANRFRSMEQQFEAESTDISLADDAAMEAAWQVAKRSVDSRKA